MPSAAPAPSVDSHPWDMRRIHQGGQLPVAGEEEGGLLGRKPKPVADLEEEEHEEEVRANA